MSGESGMVLTVQLANPVALARLGELARMFPKEVRSAQMRAASIVARKIRASVARMGNAETGKLAALSPLRQMLAPNTPPGGVLTSKGAQLCRVQKRNGGLYAGYVPGVEGVFSRWQDGGDTPLLKPQRAHLHRMLVFVGHRGAEVPETASQPRRPVVAPIFERTRKDYPEWVLGAALKLIDKKLTKAGS